MRGVGGIVAVNVGRVGDAADCRGPCVGLVLDACDDAREMREAGGGGVWLCWV